MEAKIVNCKWCAVMIMTIISRYIAILMLCLSINSACAKRQAVLKPQEPIEPIKGESPPSNKLEPAKTVSDEFEKYFVARDIIENEVKERYPEAMKLLLSIPPETEHVNDVYQLIAVLSIKEKRYEDAISYFKKILEKDNKDIKALIGTGMALYNLGDLAGAQDYCLQALKVDNYNIAALTDIGVIFYREGKYDDALKYFIKARQIDKDDYRLSYNIANTYYAKDMLSEAEEYYKEALKLNPEVYAAKTNLAIIYLKNGKYERVLSLLETPPGKVPPRYAPIYINKALALKALGRLKEAEMNYLKAIEIDNKSPIALKDIGILYDIYMGQREKAMLYYQRYIDIDGPKREKEEVAGWINTIKGSGAKKKLKEDLLPNEN